MSRDDRDLYLSEVEEALASARIGQEIPTVYPTHLWERGQEIRSELSCLGTTVEEEAFASFLDDLVEEHGADLVDFTLVKFGLVTVGGRIHEDSLSPLSIAERIMKRFREEPEVFPDVLRRVLGEELASADRSRTADLLTFEDRSREELRELAALSGNGLFEEFLRFAEDLDRIFEGQAYVFSYLENRYAHAMDHSFYTPETLAVQIGLDYLTHRDRYQMAILDDYERLIANGQVNPLSQPYSAQ